MIYGWLVWGGGGVRAHVQHYPPFNTQTHLILTWNLTFKMHSTPFKFKDRIWSTIKSYVKMSQTWTFQPGKCL